MVGTPEEIVERLHPMVEAGVAYDPAPVEKFAREVIPNVG
jgi:alkanesulfonate monooxygenase SsuD/methylene tetrahydromethanopterin reductase-like flavin-dependent oxidoreductase (luciferase family)